jgi:hypothetical protein
MQRNGHSYAAIALHPGKKHGSSSNGRIGGGGGGADRSGLFTGEDICDRNSNSSLSAHSPVANTDRATAAPKQNCTVTKFLFPKLRVKFYCRFILWPNLRWRQCVMWQWIEWQDDWNGELKRLRCNAGRSTVLVLGRAAHKQILLKSSIMIPNDPNDNPTRDLAVTDLKL